MIQKMSTSDVMRQLFPICPICKSDEGYRDSGFSDVKRFDVVCRSCQAEWTVREDSLELKRSSTFGWQDEEKNVLNVRLPFNYWRSLRKTFEKSVDVVYVGGHPDYKNSGPGKLFLTPDNVTFRTYKSCPETFCIELPFEKIKGTRVIQKDETPKGVKIAQASYGLLFGLSGIIASKTAGLNSIYKNYLLLQFEDEARTLQNMIFRFDDKPRVENLVTLGSFLQKNSKIRDMELSVPSNSSSQRADEGYPSLEDTRLTDLNVKEGKVCASCGKNLGTGSSRPYENLEQICQVYPEYIGKNLCRQCGGQYQFGILYNKKTQQERPKH